jgi:hypothetical protein
MHAIGGPVGHGALDGVQHSHNARGASVEVLTQAELQKLVLDGLCKQTKKYTKSAINERKSIETNSKPDQRD